MKPLFFACVVVGLLVSSSWTYHQPWEQTPTVYYHHPRLPQRNIPVDVMVRVINRLGLKIMEEHNKDNINNMAISPYGAGSVLVALAEGVAGESREEILSSAIFPCDLSVLRIGLRDIHRHLKSYFVPKEGFLAGLTLNSDNVSLTSEYEHILRFYGYDVASFNSALATNASGTTPTNSTAEKPPETTTTTARTTTNPPVTMQGSETQMTTEESTIPETTPSISTSSTEKVTDAPQTEAPVTEAEVMTEEARITSTTTTTTTTTETPSGGEEEAAPPTVAPAIETTLPPDAGSSSGDLAETNKPVVPEGTEPTSVASSGGSESTPEDNAPASATDSPASGPAETNSPPSAPAETNSTPSAPPEDNSSPSGPPENSSPPTGPPENSSPPSGPPENNSPPTGPPENSSPSFEQPENNSPPTGPPENSSPPSGPPENNSPPSGPPENNSPPTGPPENSNPPSGPPENNSPSTGSPENSRPPSGPPENNSPPTGPPENTSPPTGPPENNSPPSGPSENNNPSTGPPENNNPSTGQPENSSPPSGPPENTNPSTGQPENSSPPSGPSESSGTPSGPATNAETSAPEATNSPTAPAEPPQTTAAGSDNPSTSPPEDNPPSAPQTIATPSAPAETPTAPSTDTRPSAPQTDGTSSAPSAPSDTPSSTSGEASTAPSTTSSGSSSPQDAPTATTGADASSTSGSSAEADEDEGTDEPGSDEGEERSAASSNDIGRFLAQPKENPSAKRQAIGGAFTEAPLPLPLTLSPIKPSHLDGVNETPQLGFQNTNRIFRNGKRSLRTRRKRFTDRRFGPREEVIHRRYYDEFNLPELNTYGFETQRPPHVPPPLTFLVNGKTEEANVNFMTYDTILPFYFAPELNAMVLRFPLDIPKYYLLLVLPVDEQGVDKLICHLSAQTDLKYLVSKLKNSYVKASIPSFTLKGVVSLTQTLQKMGIQKVFEPRQANFSKMTKDKDIFVTNIEQAVTVTIKNYLVQAPNAYTYDRYNPIIFRATHPFLYFVMDSHLDVTLMAGKISNPLNYRIR